MKQSVTDNSNKDKQEIILLISDIIQKQDTYFKAVLTTYTAQINKI